MSYLDFNNIQYVKTIDTSEEVLLGGFTVDNNQELAHIVLHILINGATPTTETMKIKVWADSSCTLSLFESDTITLSDIENVSDKWLGSVRFDFARQNISSGYSYYLSLVTSNYTRTAGYYLGVVRDWPIQTNDFTISHPKNYPSKFEVLGYRI